MRSSADWARGARRRRIRRPRARPIAAAAAAGAVLTFAGTLAGCGGSGAAAATGTGRTQPSTATRTATGAAAPNTSSGSVAVPAGARTASAAAVPMPPGDIPGWHQIFADDFPTDVPVGGFSGCDNGATRTCTGLPATVAAKWWAYPDGWKDTSGQGTYMPSETMSIANGEMHIHMFTSNGRTMVAAPVPKIPAPAGPEGGQTYGRYAVRWMVKAPTASFKLAWLLWPDSEKFPGDGEIDFPEGQLNGDITAFMHRRGATADNDQNEFDTAVPISSGWHTSIVEWTATGCTFILDGTVTGKADARIPDTPMHWVLQSETVPDRVTHSADTADIYIAWVAIYRPD
ncbi:glycoside hydrolase family 16 protein [Actinospica sp. MGRD01-02]|uniref:Glycoside hydrolase family 16 protein n=1 Tax=Actinospica acidithermotolerans TaxID=2828514 RepID=A0A941EE94_9ACTN|nr:glycoside hydrolase family 16 protein [Actinospica acidithermotolerans]MBR7828813.1 glycoside hydrolase family 16 protein [Actinospica acidithermotolerans]